MGKLHKLLSALLNGQRAIKPFVRVPYSQFFVEVLRILVSTGFIYSFVVTERELKTFSRVKFKANSKFYCVEKTPQQIIVKLKYTPYGPAIGQIQQFSSPGRSYFVKVTEFPRVWSKFKKEKQINWKSSMAENDKLILLPTSRGIMGMEEAMQKNIGGKLLCSIV